MGGPKFSFDFGIDFDFDFGFDFDEGGPNIYEKRFSRGEGAYIATHLAAT